MFNDLTHQCLDTVCEKMLNSSKLLCVFVCNRKKENMSHLIGLQEK